MKNSEEQEKEYLCLKPTTRDNLIKLHTLMCNRAEDIMLRKNSDYGANTDPFRNFHQFGALGIIVRLSDKLARMRTFLEKLEHGEKLSVVEESIDDTVLDVINYAILFSGYVRVFGPNK